MDRLFIIGKGASLKGFDFSRLKDEYTICLNHAVFDVPNPSALCFMDKGFYTEHKDFVDNFKGEIFASVATGFPQGLPPAFGTSCLSGLFALNVALELSERVYLLGFDLTRTEEWPYYKDNFGKKEKKMFDKKDGSYKLFYEDPDFITHRVNRFEELFADKKDRVFNCNPKSGIKTFPFINIDRVLDEKN